MHDFSRFIREIPDFPKPGVSFKDITPLIGNPTVFHKVIDEFALRYKLEAIDAVVGIDARGFIFGSALAYRLGTAFVPVRKSGKLPFDKYEVTYDLEYGSDTVAIHRDAFSKDSRVLICDDLLATGGTLAASIKLVEKLEGHIVGIAILLELTELNGREKIPNYDIFSLIRY
ncbi:MAG: adenine phosphoribosyltransferase [Candidatus Poribacteria bacterium]|nr:adenine phosphoribosyltransferase [Candidatus Poribacteria bacterium]